MTTERLDLRLAPAALGAWGAAAMSLGWPAGRALVGGLLLLGVKPYRHAHHESNRKKT